MSKHWGEINSNFVEEIPDISEDIGRSMSENFFAKYEEQDSEANNSNNIIKIEVPPLNPDVLYAISLHKHYSHVASLIKIHNESSKNVEKVELKPPPKPEIAENPLNLSSTDFKEFKQGEEVNIIDLSRGVVQDISKKCIATLFAHIGYENSEQSALDVLVEVLGQFYAKIGHHLKVATEDRESRLYFGFPNTIERVLVESGIGGVKALDEYYRFQVKNYNDVLENRCKNLYEDYTNLSIPKVPSPVDKYSKVMRVKVEEKDVNEAENPEVHFSTIDGDVNFSILEPGYQLLNSLEAETNLQALVEEDLTVGPSPGEEVLNPFSKRKRFK